MSTDLTPPITDDEVRALPLADARADLLRELLAEAGAQAEPVRRPRRWLVPLAAAAAVLAVGVPLGVLQLTGDDGTREPGVATDPGPSAPPTSPPAFQVRTVGLTSEDPMSDDPERQEVEDFVCPSEPVAAPVEQAELACDGRGVRYLLGAAAVQGGVVSAEAVPPGQQLATWSVVLQLDDEASAALTDLSEQLVGTDLRAALVLDGTVLSAPTINGVLTSGQLQLGGDYTQAEATDLADRLAQP